MGYKSLKKTYFLDDVRIGKRFRNGWNDMISSEKMKKMSEVTQGNIEWKKITDYGRPMKPIFIEVPNFWAWADTFWDIWGIFSRTISTHFGTVSPLSIFSIIQPLFLRSFKYYLGRI